MVGLNWMHLLGFIQMYILVMSILRDVGLELFRCIIMGEQTIESLCVDGLMTLIRAERLGEQVDRTLINSLVKMLCSLQVQKTGFLFYFLRI